MGRIYFKLPQCLSFQDLPGYKQLAILTCGALVMVILVVLLIHSFFLADPEEVTSNSHHFLPTVPDINSHHSYYSYGPNVRYGIVIDCGSSGSRVYVYIWPPHSGNPKDLLSIQQLKDQFNQPVVKKVSPGLDTFEEKPEDASDYLYPLLKYAAEHIPQKLHKETLLYILATAGMRLLSEESQQAILQDLQRDIPKSFDFVIAENNFEVISGKQEGVYAWIAANYALQKFSHGDEDRYEHPLVAVDVPGENGEVTQHVRRRTVGMIDMGGGSMQIAYEITNNVESIPKNLVAEFNLGCQSYDAEHTYRVYVTTFLGYGANEARSRYEEILIRDYTLSLPRSLSKEDMTRRDTQIKTIRPETKALTQTIMKIKDEQVNKNITGGMENQKSVQIPESVQIPKAVQIPTAKQVNPLVANNGYLSRAGIRRRRSVILEGVDKSGSNKTDVTQQGDSMQKQEEVVKQLFNNSLPIRIRQVTSPRSLSTLKSAQIPPPVATGPIIIRDPCLQSGLTIQAQEPDYTNIYNFAGTGSFDECKKAMGQLLNQTVACSYPPCSMNGMHQPTISFHNSEFYGFSEFWYTMEDVFRIGGLYEHEIFENHAKDFCGKKWSSLMNLYEKKLYPKADEKRFKMECFKSAWLTTVLHQGLHFPETYKGLHSVQFINNRDVQWTLGALIHRTRYLPLRELQGPPGQSKFKPPWLVTSHILDNEYLLLLCFLVVLTAILIYIRRLGLCSTKQKGGDMSRVPSMSYFMTDMDQVEQGVKLLSDYTYPDR